MYWRRTCLVNVVIALVPKPPDLGQFTFPNYIILDFIELFCHFKPRVIIFYIPFFIYLYIPTFIATTSIYLYIRYIDNLFYINISKYCFSLFRKS